MTTPQTNSAAPGNRIAGDRGETSRADNAAIAMVCPPAVSSITRGPVENSDAPSLSAVAGLGAEGELIIGIVGIEAVQFEQIGVGRRLVRPGHGPHGTIEVGWQR